jgi:hypothetical protein
MLRINFTGVCGGFIRECEQAALAYPGPPYIAIYQLGDANIAFDRPKISLPDAAGCVQEDNVI